MEQFLLSDRNQNEINLSVFYNLFIKEYQNKLEEHFKSREVYERMYDRFYTAKRTKGINFKFKDCEFKDYLNELKRCKTYKIVNDLRFQYLMNDDGNFIPKPLVDIFGKNSSNCEKSTNLGNGISVSGNSIMIYINMPGHGLLKLVQNLPNNKENVLASIMIRHVIQSYLVIRIAEEFYKRYLIDNELLDYIMDQRNKITYLDGCSLDVKSWDIAKDILYNKKVFSKVDTIFNNKSIEHINKFSSKVEEYCKFKIRRERILPNREFIVKYYESIDLTNALYVFSKINNRVDKKNIPNKISLETLF